MHNFAGNYEFPHVAGIHPMDNQVQRVNFLLNHPYAFDLSEMGTGKTYTAIWAADILQRECGGSVLVLAPLTTLETVWRKSCGDILGDLSRFVLLSGGGDKKAATIRATCNKFIIGNYECLLNSDIRAAILASDINVVIIDELTAFKHNNTSRSKHLAEVTKGRVVWGLTATPMPNTPLNAHGIARAVRWDYKESFTSFRNRTHLRKDMWVWVPKEDAVEKAQRILQPSIRILRDECTTLPPCTTERRSVRLSAKSASLFKELRRDAMASLASGRTIGTAHEAALRNKLLQVCGGAVYVDASEDRGRDVEALDFGQRANEITDLLEQTDEKIVIFVPYRSQLALLTKRIKAEGHSAIAIHGDVKPANRAKIIDSFQRLPHPRVLVADPRTMAHGVELTAASIICWWLPIDSNELYQQAIGRLTRRGQTRHVKVIQLCGTGLEALIYDRLERRESLQGALLAALNTGG